MVELRHAFRFSLEESLSQRIKHFCVLHHVDITRLYAVIWGYYHSLMTGNNADVRIKDPSGTIFPLNIQVDMEKSVLDFLSQIFDENLKNVSQWDHASDNMNILMDLSGGMRTGDGHDITAAISQEMDLFWIAYRIHSDSITERMLERIHLRLSTIIAQMLHNTSVALKEIRLIGETEMEEVLAQFNDNYSNNCKDRTYIELFEEQVDKHSDHIALEFKEETLTYREFNSRANRVGQILREAGAKPDVIVGVITDRSIPMMVGLYGVLKSGAAYLPIDPELPVQRIHYLLENSKVSVVLIEEKYRGILAAKEDIIIIPLSIGDEGRADNLEHISAPGNLAYVIYTSGTTGFPKGVMVENRNLVNFTQWMLQDGFSPEDIILHKTTYAFDLSIWEIFVGCLAGAKVVLLPKEDEKEPVQIMKAIKEYKVTRTSFVPSVLEEFTLIADWDDLSSLKRIVLSGEAMPLELAKRFNEGSRGRTQLVNCYGPTEATVFATSYMIPTDECLDEVHIGKPISNTSIYIINDNGICGVGMPGELYIGGDGVTRGYINKPELTKERFVDNPYIPGEKMYRTGDLACWMEGGTLKYLGRLDDQVKIRGYRIELAEVSSKLRSIDGVYNAVVIKREDYGYPYLCGYVIGSDTLDTRQIKEKLSEFMPEYMIPSQILKLDSLPVTKNGKLDKQALPKPEFISLKAYVAPSNPSEAGLIAIFEEVLGISVIGMDDSFFELGGNSLRATRLVNLVEQKYGTRLAIRDVFNAPTARQLHHLITNSFEKTDISYEPLEVQQSANSSYPMSYTQKRMYIIQQMNADSVAYNVPFVVRVEGKLDLNLLYDALSRLCQRHELLRTRFTYDQGHFQQVIEDEVELTLSFSKGKQNDLPELLRNFVQPFDLNQAPLMRVEMIEISEDTTFLMFDLHHIIFDDGSKTILLQDLARYYNRDELPPLKVQYKDYSSWHNTRDMQAQESYWLEQYAGDIPVLDLKTDYPRPQQQSFEGSSITTYLNTEVKEIMKQWSRNSGMTEYMILLSCFMYLLSRYSRQDEIIVGSPIAGRVHPETEHMLGMFVNTLAMKGNLREEQTFRELFHQVREQCLKAYEHQEYPFERLVEKTGVERDPSRNPLFDVMFVLQNHEKTPVSIGGLDCSFVSTDSVAASFDLTLSVEEVPEGYALNWEYCTSLFHEATICAMAEHFSHVVKHALQNPDQRITQIELLSTDEKNRILKAFNDTVFPLPEQQTIVTLFEEQAARSPERIAVEHEMKALSYGELNARANSVAQRLRDLGTGPDQIVGLVLERSIEMIIGMIGILKAGGAYLPIDPSYPVERIRYMLQDSRVQCILTGHGSEKAAVSLHEMTVINLLENSEVSEMNAEPVATPEHLAYVIYTSGTTGTPKGVMIEHRNVVNQSIWQMTEGNYGPDSVIIQKTTHVFDGSVWEIFPCLLAGSRLRIVSDWQHQDPEQLLELMPYSHIALIPSMLRIVLEYAEAHNKVEPLMNVERLYLAAEPVTLDLLQKYEGLTGGSIDRLSNLYGPTEATVTATAYYFKEGDQTSRVLIGKPIFNTRVYILNGDQLCGIGMPGELCIAGAGVARGYLNLPDLTAEKFVDDPFYPGERMYRTGDLACWTHQGDIEFLGRIGEQVKIRGFRVEIGEVESRLRQVEGVQDAAVISLEDKGELFLSGYVVGQNLPDMQDIRTGLSEILPAYMVPSYITELTSLPLTTNGKINKRALPKPHIERVKESSEAGNEIEAVVQEAFRQTLGIEHVHHDDSFFDLGGHSLRAMRLINFLEKRLNQRLTLREILTAKTVRNLSRLIMTAQSTSHYDPIEVQPREGSYPMSSVQRRIYLIHEMQGGDITYNIPFMFKTDALDMERLERAFVRLCQRHEPLRTSFHSKEGDFLQIIHDQVSFKLEHVEANQNDASAMMQQFVRPFDLTAAPLFRAGVSKVSADEHIVILDIHHIIFDEGSKKSLISDLLHLYNGEELPELRLQYKDYAVWESRQDLSKQEQYWLKEFAEELPILDLQTDFPRPRQQSHKGSSIDYLLDTSSSEAIKQLARHHGVTEYVVLMSVFMLLMNRYSRQNTIVVGSPVSGRVHPDTDEMVGMFVNTLAIKGIIHPEDTFLTFVQQIQDKVLAAGENQEYPFDALVENIVPERDPSRNPIFDVVFVSNDQQLEFSAGTTRLLPMHSSSLASTFDLTVSMAETGQGYTLHWEYCTDLFREETIKRMASHYQVLLANALSNSQKEMRLYPMLTPQEEHFILNEFNATDTAYPSDRSMVDLFVDQVTHTPEKLAVVSEEEQVTYRELHERSGRLASQLQALGVKRGEYVGIMVERQVSTIVGILGILKAGGAYMPIDPKYPERRVTYMLGDSGTKVVLTGEREVPLLADEVEVVQVSLGAVAGGTCEAVETETDIEAGEAGLTGERFEAGPAKAGDVAYLIYTSGTTGEPKGVMIEHRSVNRLVKQTNYVDFTDVRILQTGSLSFDASTFEIWGALLNGGTLFLMEEEILMDPVSLKEAITRYEINTMWLTVSLFNYIVTEHVEAFDPLTQLIIGGEQVSSRHVQLLRERNGDIRLVNGYGPTESTTFAVTFDIGKGGSAPIPIGKPISNTQVYVLNESGLCGIGVPGEICISGPGLARGYLNQPEQTAERFLSHPLLPGQRIYRTGDLGCWRADGNIEYLGRLDQQVKIRGFRIELEEIAGQLRKFPDVQDAAVMVWEENGEKFLCGYIAATSRLDLARVRGYMEEELPSYMVPSHLEQLVQLPVTANGKLDHKALPKPDFATLSGKIYHPPTDAVETAVAEVFREVLGVDRISIDDNFFELGGHSLRATKVVNAIDQALGVRLSLRQILMERTVRNLSQIIRARLEDSQNLPSTSMHSQIAIAVEEED
ncbi:non-ribosomal peptide synthetase [Paenibacillus faecalis]|uniref:non-ribosomal peptide synthetase n=1 Tax=Paenibacillus faecalis TaxID=2079532 RepID=UPI000D0F0B4A|nr:non-ribosomal peptide synthetase [Paenibacillus faecalis]